MKNLPPVYNFTHKFSTKQRQEYLAAAAAFVIKGGLAIFPTETVYGLGAAISCPKAVQQIYHIKQRDPRKPFSWHIGDVQQVTGHLPREVMTPLFWRLAEAFWPGPLTLVVADGQGGTIGLRYPDCALFTELARAVGQPLLASSANLSGSKSPCCLADIDDTILRQVDVVLDGGPTVCQMDSTVLDISSDVPKILRQGALLASQLLPICGQAGLKDG